MRHTVASDDCHLLRVRAGSIGGLNDLLQRLTTLPLSLSMNATIAMQTHCEKIGGIDLGMEEER